MLQFEYLITVPTRHFNIELGFTEGGKYLWVNRVETERDKGLRLLLGEPLKSGVAIEARDAMFIVDSDKRKVSVGGRSITLAEVAEELYSSYLRTSNPMIRLRTPSDTVRDFLDGVTDFLFDRLFPSLGLYAGIALLPRSLLERGKSYAYEPSLKAYALAIHERFRR